MTIGGMIVIVAGLVVAALGWSVAHYSARQSAARRAHIVMTKAAADQAASALAAADYSKHLADVALGIGDKAGPIGTGMLPAAAFKVGSFDPATIVASWPAAPRDR